jgi:hypothetical protein
LLPFGTSFARNLRCAVSCIREPKGRAENSATGVDVVLLLQNVRETTMSLLLGKERTLARWIKNETEILAPAKMGARGQVVKRIQEWLNLNGFGLAIDGDFGPVTKKRVEQFQESNGLKVTGLVTPETFQVLVSPLRRVISAIVPEGQSFPNLVFKYAEAHLTQNPRETGGQNRGPWVRLYMKGHEGADWPWCAGFVSFVLRQAAESLEINEPIEGSFSCDTLAAQAMDAGLFVRESDLVKGLKTIKDSTTCIFLVRRTNNDWNHTGFATAFEDLSFETIEGNTNDEGSREGFEVCSRSRGYSDKDFILL